MSDICHIVRGFNGESSDILGVFECDLEAAVVQELFEGKYDRFEVEAWLIKGDAIFDTWQIAKENIYKDGAKVLYNEDGQRYIGVVVYSDLNQRNGFQNILYRIMRGTAIDYVLGSDITGKLTKK